MKKLTIKKPAISSSGKQGMLFTVSALSLAVSMAVQAQQDDIVDTPRAEKFDAVPAIEEMLIEGRLRNAAENIVVQRLDAEVAMDIIDAEMISRIGDSSVAAALRRLPGVTTVDDKFVFVRGLGERYSKSLLNGAEVPSPDLSRSVIPLDLFPTSILKALSVQKGYSVDMPSQFGGGTVNILTKSIPNDFMLSMQLGTGDHSESSGSFNTYRGGGDDSWGEDDGTRGLSSDIQSALNTYRGDFSVQGIRNLSGNEDMTTEQAQVVNRSIAKALYRDVSINSTGGQQDLSGEINIGNLWSFDNGMEFGAIAGGNYDREWRNSEIISRKFSNPREFVGFEDESTYSASITGHLAMGLRINEENSIETTNLFLRNTDDKVSVVDTFGADDNRPLSEGVGDREYKIRYEQRELEVFQLHGEHTFGDATRELLGLESLVFADGLKLNWFYSDSTATTDIPNELGIEAETIANPVTGQAISSTVKAATKANYRFTELEDILESSGFTISYPLMMQAFDIELSAGSDNWQKARAYKQLQFALDSEISAGDAILGENLSSIYSDDNIDNDALGFEIDVTGSNSESYIAASKVDALFGKMDVTWNDTVRIVAGLRYEEYKQVGLVWSPLAYESSQIATDADTLRDSVFITDDTYGALAATWMLPDFWAENFQLRFSYAESTIRPDLRDISSSSYVDPLTGATVFGNPDVTPSSIDNFDIRAEWFFESGDSFTVTGFWKDIENPIEQFEKAAGGTKTAVEILNADSGTMKGLEFEFLKNLGVLGEGFESLFVQGNLVLLDHELSVGSSADAPTNLKRGFVGASDFSGNLLVGFDSDDNLHSATLSYNVFDERLYFAGRNGEPDSFEQPFNSVDLTYSFYPTDAFTLKLKVQNLLNEDVTIEREGVTVYEEPKGRGLSLSIKYDM